MKLSKKKYYKVVGRVRAYHPERPLYESAIIRDNDISVDYRVGELTFPAVKDTKLMVFDSLEAAKYFNAELNLDIFECQVVNPSRKGYLVKWFMVDENILNKIAKLRRSHKRYSHLCEGEIPEGTVFCDAVKLIEKVW